MWELINEFEAKRSFSHDVFVFEGDAGSNFLPDVAIADHSLTKLNDPSSTEDGLLLWDRQRGTISKDGNTIFLGLVDSDRVVGITFLTAHRITEATGLDVVPHSTSSYFDQFNAFASDGY